MAEQALFFVRLVKDIIDPTGDTGLFIPKGTICTALEVNDDLLMVRAPNGAVFDIEYEDFMVIRSKTAAVK